VQWKISEKSVALFFGFQINSFCAASCLLKILQLRREKQEQERAREREREGERPACLLEILQFWGKRWQKTETCLLAEISSILWKEMKRERETCLLAEISPILWKEMKREREICLLAAYSPIRERDGGRHSERGPEGKRELLVILQFWRERLQRQTDLCL
jgi:hypothetical protein